jgi:hypothetical protein
MLKPKPYLTHGGACRMSVCGQLSRGSLALSAQLIHHGLSRDLGVRAQALGARRE